MKTTRNIYCSGCLQTRAFIDCTSYFLCSGCGKRLEKCVQALSRPAIKAQVA